MLETEFDYDLVKTRFIDQVNKENTASICTVNSPWSRDMVDKIIGAMEKGNEAMKQNETVDTFQWKVLSKYDVIKASKSSLSGKVDDDASVLVLRETSHKKKSWKAIIPSEECFDIVAQAHLDTNHGNYQRMLNEIQEKFVIKPSNISLLINLCNICNSNSINTLNEYEYRSYNTLIIDLSQYPDGQFQYLLVLAVNKNNFLHIRPLVTKENIEIAVELLKIFMDFGAPYQLNTSDTALFRSALEIVYKICPDIKVNVDKAHESAEFVKIEKQVKRSIRDWIIESRSRRWATGCRMVQWELNNTPVGNVTPYECLFGGTPNDALSTKPKWTVSEVEKNDYQKNIDLFDELYIFEDQAEEISQVKKIITGHNRVNKGSHCHVCGYEARRVTTCHKCDKYMHTICGTRIVVDRNVFTICPKCNIGDS